jgi:hypothetical protein
MWYISSNQNFVDTVSEEFLSETLQVMMPTGPTVSLPEDFKMPFVMENWE